MYARVWLSIVGGSDKYYNYLNFLPCDQISSQNTEIS